MEYDKLIVEAFKASTFDMCQERLQEGGYCIQLVLYQCQRILSIEAALMLPL